MSLRRKQHPPLWQSFAGGGIGSVLGCTACHPFDVIKIRLQMQGAGAKGVKAATNYQMFWEIVRTDGFVNGMVYGVSSQILRACTYYTIKIGMYDVIKRGVFDEQPGIPLPLYQKMEMNP